MPWLRSTTDDPRRWGWSALLATAGGFAIVLTGFAEGVLALGRFAVGFLLALGGVLVSDTRSYLSGHRIHLRPDQA
jgi:hypothetical protein